MGYPNQGGSRLRIREPSVVQEDAPRHLVRVKVELA